jgi:hypothetical protein
MIAEAIGWLYGYLNFEVRATRVKYVVDNLFKCGMQGSTTGAA